MTDKKDSPDLITVGEQLPNGAFKCVRTSEGPEGGLKVEVGEIGMLAEGQPIQPGQEVISVEQGPLPGQLRVTASTGRLSGPAQVSTPKYRENWDQIFAKKNEGPDRSLN